MLTGSQLPLTRGKATEIYEDCSTEIRNTNDVFLGLIKCPKVGGPRPARPNSFRRLCHTWEI